MVGDTYSTCPMCGGEDGQGCYPNCPSQEVATLRAELDRLSNANDQVWANNERLRRFVERVAKLFDGKSLGKDARQALAQEKQQGDDPLRGIDLPCCECGARYATRGEAMLPDGRWVCSGDCERKALTQEKPHDR